MQRIDELNELYAYNRWANAQILEAVAPLTEEQFTRDLGNSFPSIRDTLVHLMTADWIWLSRWLGESPTTEPEGWAASSFSELQRRWREVEEQRAGFLASLSENRLDEVFHYRNTAGRPFSATFAQTLRHVVNHSTYHRGQVTTMLRQLGAPAHATDLIHFYRTVVTAKGPE